MLYKNIKLYEERDDVSLTTYVLDDSIEMLNGKKRGAVLICPGGAYLYCSDREGEPIAMAFASMGYHAFVLKYSVYNENKGVNTAENIIPDMEKTWFEKENIRFPNAMRDIGKALLCIRDHREEWLVDTDKVALCGFSAGAHNCAMYSVYYNKPEITEFLGVKEGEIKPAAVILGYTLSNYHLLLKSEIAGTPLFKASMQAYLGKEELIDEELLTMISPAMLVNETTPPMFLWATDDDQLVEANHTLEMACALAKNKVPYEVHVFEGGAHGMALATQATAGEKSQIRPDIALWVSMAETWLCKKIGLKVPEEKSGGF